MAEPSVLEVRFFLRPLFYMKIELNKRQDRRNRRRIKKGQRNKDNYYQRMSRRTERCDSCGGEMSWCTCCECFTKTCCVPYGTCQCS